MNGIAGVHDDESTGSGDVGINAFSATSPDNDIGPMSNVPFDFRDRFWPVRGRPHCTPRLQSADSTDRVFEVMPCAEVGRGAVMINTAATGVLRLFHLRRRAS